LCELTRLPWLAFVALVFFSCVVCVERDRLLLDFENEVRILSRVQHPRILLFLGCINQAPNDYVIMTEILAGNVCQVLKKTKETGKAISWDISTQIMLDVSEAMDFLHRYQQSIETQTVFCCNVSNSLFFSCSLLLSLCFFRAVFWLCI
jgi:hypothetical protein